MAAVTVGQTNQTKVTYCPSTLEDINLGQRSTLVGGVFTEETDINIAYMNPCETNNQYTILLKCYNTFPIPTSLCPSYQNRIYQFH